MMGVTVLATVITLLPLFFVLVYLVARGSRASTWPSSPTCPRRSGETGGGMANAIVGTLELIGLAEPDRACRSESARAYTWRRIRRHAVQRARRASRADVLMGMPSIVVGIFAYAVVVRPMGGFSTLAGARRAGASS